MKVLLLAVAALMVLSACNTQKSAGDEGEGEAAASVQQKQRDISTETLSAIDPEIAVYAESVEAAKNEYENGGDPTSKQVLVKAYLAFGDYMQYESPVSPRQGKYFRALVEYRHVLEIDPENAQAKKEIAQIENIYRSMGRPIPES